MPTYEFRCPRGHEFEKFYRTISGAEAHAACPECGLPAERVMSAAGFAFKGSGFYLTDYGRNAHRDKGTPDGRGGGVAEGGSDSANGDAKGDAKSDAKSDARGESKADAPATPAASSEPKPAPDQKKAKAVDAKPAAPTKKSTGE